MDRIQGYVHSLPEGVDQELVKKYALKKMALAFATFKNTTPQPRNSDRQTVGISRYTDGQSVDIKLYRRTNPVGASPVGKSFYRQTLLISTNNLLE